jgi:ubiquinone/menaquinone biosynthesis C-methylase UbiE
MDFPKYRKWGAYHWKLYNDNTKYKRHADRVAAWVKEPHVLDVGAGDGKITSLLGPIAIGIDNEPLAVSLAIEKGVHVLLGDAYDIPFQDATFQSVLMADALEHFEHPTEALREARRVLRDYLYVTTPPKRDDGKLTDRFHYREFSPRELQDIVEGVGFELVGEIDVVEKDKVQYAKFRRC